MILNTKNFDSKRIVCTSRDGNSKEFLLRPFEIGDEEGIKECVTEEYESSYFKKDFYALDKIRANAFGDHYRFFVAEADDEIAGMEIIQIFNGDEDYLEPATLIVKKKYRHYSLAFALTEYVFECAKSMNPSALFSHVVTFHMISQCVGEDLGMISTGFRLGRFLTEKMNNSYVKGKCDKYSEGILILPITGKDAGTIYIPQEVRPYADKIYRRLEVDYNIADIPDVNELKTVEEGIPDHCLVDIKKDYEQRFATVKVIEEGRDIRDKMQELIESFGKEPYWVIQISLCINEKNIYYLYEELKKTGFFFAGLKPLCGRCEKMYMQWIGETNLNMNEYVLTDSFKEIRADLEKYMLKGEKI